MTFFPYRIFFICQKEDLLLLVLFKINLKGVQMYRLFIIALFCMGQAFAQWGESHGNWDQSKGTVARNLRLIPLPPPPSGAGPNSQEYRQWKQEYGSSYSGRQQRPVRRTSGSMQFPQTAEGTYYRYRSGPYIGNRNTRDSNLLSGSDLLWGFGLGFGAIGGIALSVMAVDTYKARHIRATERLRQELAEELRLDINDEQLNLLGAEAKQAKLEDLEAEVLAEQSRRLEYGTATIPDSPKEVYSSWYLEQEYKGLDDGQLKLLGEAAREEGLEDFYAEILAEQRRRSQDCVQMAVHIM